MTAVNRVREALERAGSQTRDGGKTWTCPAHDDTRPSLSLDQAERRALLHCFGGCSTEGVVAAIGLTMADLFDDERVRDERAPTEPESAARVEILGPPTEAQLRALERTRRVLRPETLTALKIVRARCWGAEWLGIPTLAGSWKLWALDGSGRPRRDDKEKLVRKNVRPVSLVVSPALLVEEAPPVERLWDVEGESDLLACVDAGLAHVITGTGGAKALDAYERHGERLLGFGPREVCIVRDLDDAGRSGAEKSAAWWRAQGVPVRIVELPEALGRGGDVRDYLNGRPANGSDASEPLGDVCDLDALANQAKVLDPLQPRRDSSNSQASHLEFVSLGELFAEPPEETRWLVENRLPAGGLSILAGKPKAGKSTLARALALSVARGVPWLGMPTTQGAVAYVALEDKRHELRAHFAALGASGTEPLSVFVGTAPKDAITELREYAVRVRPVLIVVDTVFRLARVRDVNDYAAVTAALEPLLAITRETGAHVLLVGHAKKGNASGGDAILGSTATFGTVDTALILTRGENHRTLSSIQRYGDDLPETVIGLDPETRRPLAAGTREAADQTAAEDQVLAILGGQANDSLTEDEILAAATGATRTLRAALRSLFAARRIQRRGTGRRGDPYLYSAGLENEGVSDSRSLVPTLYAERENEKREFEPHTPKDSGNARSRAPESPGGEVVDSDISEVFRI